MEKNIHPSLQLTAFLSLQLTHLFTKYFHRSSCYCQCMFFYHSSFFTISSYYCHPAQHPTWHLMASQEFIYFSCTTSTANATYFDRHAFWRMSYKFSFGYAEIRLAIRSSCRVEREAPMDFSYNVKQIQLSPIWWPYDLRLDKHAQTIFF